MTKMINIILVVLIVLAAAIAIVAQRPALQTPATAVIKIEMRINGQLVEELIRNVAWKRDGSTAHFTVSLNKNRAPIPEVIDLSRGMMTMFDPVTQTMAEMPTTVPQTKWLSNVLTSCEQKFATASMAVRCEPTEETILGYHNLHKVTLERAPHVYGKDSRVEMIVAPALNFFPLVKKEYIGNDLRAHSYVLSVNEGDPSEQWFRVPQYQKLSRADFIVTAEKARGSDVSSSRWVDTIRRNDAGLPPCAGNCSDPVR